MPWVHGEHRVGVYEEKGRHDTHIPRNVEERLGGVSELVHRGVEGVAIVDEANIETLWAVEVVTVLRVLCVDRGCKDQAAKSIQEERRVVHRSVGG